MSQALEQSPDGFERILIPESDVVLGAATGPPETQATACYRELRAQLAGPRSSTLEALRLQLLERTKQVLGDDAAPPRFWVPFRAETLPLLEATSLLRGFLAHTQPPVPHGIASEDAVWQDWESAIVNPRKRKEPPPSRLDPLLEALNDLTGTLAEVLQRAKAVVMQWTGSDPEREACAMGFEEDVHQIVVPQQAWLQSMQQETAQKRDEADAQQHMEVTFRRLDKEWKLRSIREEQLETVLKSLVGQFARNMLERYHLTQTTNGVSAPSTLPALLAPASLPTAPPASLLAAVQQAAPFLAAAAAQQPASLLTPVAAQPAAHMTPAAAQPASLLAAPNGSHSMSAAAPAPLFAQAAFNLPASQPAPSAAMAALAAAPVAAMPGMAPIRPTMSRDETSLESLPPDEFKRPKSRSHSSGSSQHHHHTHTISSTDSVIAALLASGGSASLSELAAQALWHSSFSGVLSYPSVELAGLLDGTRVLPEVVETGGNKPDEEAPVEDSKPPPAPEPARDPLQHVMEDGCPHVYSGKGERIKKLNKEYRRQIANLHATYAAASDADKRDIARGMFMSITSRGGKFWKSDGTEMPETTAVNKIMKALKDFRTRGSKNVIQKPEPVTETIENGSKVDEHDEDSDSFDVDDDEDEDGNAVDGSGEAADGVKQHAADALLHMMNRNGTGS